MSKITLIVPVYNGSAHISALIESVKNQTHSNWECIIVDDGSSDNSAELINAAIVGDSRFALLRQANGGCGSARNAALSKVETTYVMFADQDDLLHPQAFEIAVKAIVELGDVDCLKFRHTHFTDKAEFSRLALPTKSVRATRNGLDLVNGHRNSWSIFVWRHIFRTEAIRTTPFPPISGGEDQAWMMENSWRDLRWAEIDSVLYFNRQNPSSRSRSISKRYIDDIFASYSWILKRAENYRLDYHKFASIVNHMALMFTLSVAYRSPRSCPYAVRRLLRTRRESAAFEHAITNADSERHQSLGNARD